MVTFTVRGATPTAVAAKIGSGAYTAQTLASGALTLSLPSGTTDFAVAYACPSIQLPPIGGVNGTSTRQVVLEASTADGTSFPLSCVQTGASGQTGTLTGSVDASAIAGFSYLAIEATNGDSESGTAVSSLTPGFSFEAPAGSDRVEVLAYLTSPAGTLPLTNALAAARTFDSQQVPGALNDGNPVVLTAADKTTAQAVRFKNVPAGFADPSLHVSFNVAGKASFIVSDGPGPSYPALPAAAFESGDSYFFAAIDYQDSAAGIGVGNAVAALATTAAGGPMTFTFPAPWSYSGPAAAALPTFDFIYPGFSGKTGLQQLASMIWLTGTAPALNENGFMVLTTGNYQNGSTQVTFPDLSMLTGFLPAPASGTNVTWSAEIGQYSYPYGQAAPASSTGSLVLNMGAYRVP